MATLRFGHPEKDDPSTASAGVFLYGAANVAALYPWKAWDQQNGQDLYTVHNNSIAVNYQTYLPRVTHSIGPGISVNGTSYAYTDVRLIIGIFKGTKPTLADLETNWNDENRTSVYSPNLLVEFGHTPTYTTGGIDVSLNTDPTNGVLLTYSCQTVTTALAAGQATWWGAYYVTVQDDLPPIVGELITAVGDVSDTAGDGEIKLADTNIVLNQDYLLTPFTFAIPMEFTI